MIKVCPDCSEALDLSCFYSTGSYCKRCKNKRDTEYRLTKYKGTINEVCTRTLNKAKQRIKGKNLDYDLDREWLLERLNNGSCEVTGLPLDISSGKRTPWSVSLDRTVPEKGYTKENTKVVVWIYNAAKGEFNHRDVLALMNALKEKEDVN